MSPAARMAFSIIVSNGPCWSPDGKIFYFADSWSGEIWAYDYDQKTGAVSNRRTFAKLDTSTGGAADGSTVDAEGCLWNAQVYDGKVIRYTPQGVVDRVIDMPVKTFRSTATEAHLAATSKTFSRVPLHASACWVGMLYRRARYSRGDATL